MHAFMLAAAACAVASNADSRTELLVDAVDLIEINHCYDQQGQLVFDQLLFYDWCPDEGRYQVRDWRLLKRPMQVPRRDHASGLFVAIWRDGPALRKVSAQTIRESWTQHDPEIIEQQFLPKTERETLAKFAVWRSREVLPPRRPAEK